MIAFIYLSVNVFAMHVIFRACFCIADKTEFTFSVEKLHYAFFIGGWNEAVGCMAKILKEYKSLKVLAGKY